MLMRFSFSRFASHVCFYDFYQPSAPFACFTMFDAAEPRLSKKFILIALHCIARPTTPPKRLH
jgi:hypothetical protein